MREGTEEEWVLEQLDGWMKRQTWEWSADCWVFDGDMKRTDVGLEDDWSVLPYLS